MKKSILVIALLLFLKSGTYAQIINDLVIFSNDGDKFTLILNGERRNLTPETNVKVYSLDLATYKAKIIFENKDLDDVETNINFLDNGYECVFGLVKKSRKKHTLDYVSSTRMKSFINNNSSSTNNSTVNSNSNNNGSQNNSTNNSTNNNSSHTTAPSTYPTTNGSSNSSGNVILNNGNLGVGVNNNGGVSIKTKEGNINLGPHNETTAVINVLGNAISMHKAPEKVGCTPAMLQTQFEIAKKSIDSTASDSLKMKAANKIVNSNCLLTSQVQEMMNMFKEDQAKLEFAMNSYNHISDLMNYHKLKDSFVSEAYKKDFHTYAANHK